MKGKDNAKLLSKGEGLGILNEKEFDKEVRVYCWQNDNLDHHEHTAMLIDLATVKKKELKDLLYASWEIRASKSLFKKTSSYLSPQTISAV